MTASTTPRRGLVQIDSPDLRFTDLRWSRQLLQHRVGDEALIDAAESIHESLQNASGFRQDFGKLLQ
jgi:hypothetical protein